jgi:hypothetical protein
LGLITKQLPVCTYLAPSAKDSTASTSSSQAPAKELAKHLLHVLCQVSDQQLQCYFDQFDFSCKHPPGTAALQLLSLLLPHLQLPHPLKSLTASSLAFQMTARLLQHIAEQQQAWQQAWMLVGGQQQQLKGSAKPGCYSADTNGDDSQASRDNQPAGKARVAAAQTEQQLLVQLHQCAALLWHARLHLAGELSNVAMCRYSLQLHQSAHQGLQQLHTYCSRAGITQQMQQMLQQLLVQGAAAPLALKAGLEAAAAAVLQQSCKAASRGPGLEQQQQGSHPLLQDLKVLLGAAKAAQQMMKATSSSSSSSADAAALQQAAVELAVSGVQAWGLAAQQLGPLMLDKSVGQPLLTVSTRHTLLLHQTQC